MRYLFTLIRLFLQLSWFSFYATARLFLFMSLSGFSCLCHLPDFFFIYVIVRFFLFVSLPAPLNVIARLDRAIPLPPLSFRRMPRSSRSMTGWNNNIISRRTPQHHFLTFSSLCHCSTFSSTSHCLTSFLFMSLPDLIGQSNSLSSVIHGFSPCHLRLFSLSLSGLTG